MAHTKEPWIVKKTPSGMAFIFGPDGQRIAGAPLVSIDFDKEEAEANIKLMAAAPAMYAALHVPAEWNRIMTDHGVKPADNYLLAHGWDGRMSPDQFFDMLAAAALRIASQ